MASKLPVALQGFEIPSVCLVHLLSQRILNSLSFLARISRFLSSKVAVLNLKSTDPWEGAWSIVRFQGSISNRDLVERNQGEPLKHSSLGPFITRQISLCAKKPPNLPHVMSMLFIMVTLHGNLSV